MKEAKIGRQSDVETLVCWKQELKAWEKVANPRDDDHVCQGSLLQDRIGLMPRAMAEADERLAALVDDLLKEETAFEQAFQRVNTEEADAKTDEIERLLKPFAIDYHTDRASGSKRVNQARSLAFQCGVFGFFNLPLARTMHSYGFRSNYMVPDKPEAVDAYDNNALACAEELLASFDGWRQRGGRLIPDALPDCLPAQ